MSDPFTVNWFIPVDHRNYNAMPASVWIRCLQLLPYLEERGIRCTVNAPDDTADICVFVRSQDDKAYQLARRQKARGTRIVFDLCVNYFDEVGILRDNYGVRKEQVTECQRMVSVADTITCASQFIATRAGDFHPHVVYLPDSVDGRHFRFRKKAEDFEQRYLTAVWSGVSVKAWELNAIMPLLKSRDIKLVVISDAKPNLNGPFHYVRWKYNKFPKQILKGEICVSPSKCQNPYDMGHSLFKIGVFMAQGVPALASPVPSYREALDGDGGRICGTLDEWAEALDQLLEDRALLAAWSHKAQASLEAFHTENVLKKYVELFKSICGG